MPNTVVDFKNINLLTEGQYEGLTPSDNELYSVRLPAVLVETYSSGSNWYRLYSDGWCEQGSSLSGSFNKNSTITFLKQYADDSYTVIANGLRGTDEGTALAVYVKNTDGFQIEASRSSAANVTLTRIDYIAKGYAA